MMRKICLIFFCIVPAWLQAQVTISVQLPPGGLIQKDQLWNVAVMNGGNAAFDVFLLLSLQDVSTGQTVLTASTRSITLQPGVKTLRVQDLLPVQYNYTAAGIDGNYIPLGAYTACYTVSRFTTETQIPVATECVRININPLSPPLLNFPADKSILTVPYPQFTWVPPAPISMFGDLSYDLNVVEVLEGQSATEAISSNVPLYSRTLLHTPFEQYATSYSPLEQGKTYAWQVTARNGMNYASATEIWTFHLVQDSSQASLRENTFLTFRNDGMTSGVIHKLNIRELRIKYRSYAGKYSGSFRFFDNTHKAVETTTRMISNGDNYLLFELERKFEKNKVYTVEFTDERGKISSISFIIP